MHLRFIPVLLAAAALACTPGKQRNGLRVDLPPLPESVLEEISGTDFQSGPGTRVPEVFDRGQWSLPTAGRRLLALVGEGAENRWLDSAQAELAGQVAGYLMAFQFDEDEDNFALPGAALALTGMLYSAPGKLDYRYRYGLSRMWYSYREISSPPDYLGDLVLYVAGTALSRGLPLLGAVLVDYRARSGSAAAGAKTFTMAGKEEEFLGGFDLPGRAGESLHRALESGDLEGARAEVARYYREKLSGLEYLTDPGEVDLAEAEDALKNIFILRAHMIRRHDFGPRVDWTTVLDGDIESNVSLNHHPHLLLLARAWKKTGDTRFRDHLIELMKSWLEQSPRPDIGQGELQWRTLEVGNRAAARWPQLLALGARDSVFAAELLYPMVRCLYQHADYLMVHNLRHPNNWSQVESSGLLSAAMLLSEHRDSERFRRTALRRFRYLNRELYFPDGLQVENSFYYHTFPLGTQMQVFELATSLGTELDTAWTGVLERGIGALVLGALPDGSLPMVSDVGPYKSYVGGWQARGRRMFPQNPLFRYPVGVPEAEFVPAPEVTSYFFPYAGYGIMRQDWTLQAQYLLFEAGFYGTNHQHEDKLNIILYAYGRELLHDPGIYRYSRDAFEIYFRSSRGHNLVLVDGKGQRREMFFDKDKPYAGLSFPDAESRWLDRSTHLLAAGACRSGFAEKIHPLWYHGPWDDERATLVPVEHQRKVLWVKGEYWVMTDLLTGEGTHRVEQVFHFSPVLREHSADGVDPGEVVLQGGRLAVSRNAGVANLAVMQVGGGDLQARRQKGATGPHAGWTSLYGENPAWDVTFQAERGLPAALTVVLYPLHPGETSVPALRTVRQDSRVAVFDLESDSHTDRVVLAAGREMSVDFEGGSFEGEVLVLRKVPGGEFRPLLHEGGKRLILQGREAALPESR
ncbi:MAG: alginate lyase family protein [Candidatus Glassbacteria bacterium]|nr:alginate lyase family protein [Candidatus Glassbacteria bacterium]